MNKKITLDGQDFELVPVESETKQPSWPPEVGDTVTVRSDLVDGRIYGGIDFISAMEVFCGKTVTVTALKYGMMGLDDDVTYCFSLEMLVKPEAVEREAKAEAALDRQAERVEAALPQIAAKLKAEIEAEDKPEAATEPVKCTEAQRREQLSPLFSNGVVMLDDIIAIDKKMGMIQEGGE